MSEGSLRKIVAVSGSIVAIAIASYFTLSDDGVKRIEVNEAVRTVAYLDPVGIPTVCAGITKNVKLGDRYTPDQCSQMLKEVTSEAGQAVARCVSAAISQTQYDILIDFTHNVGATKMCNSTLIKYLNAGQCIKASAQFERWVYAKGRKLPGLVKRRKVNRIEFERDCPK